MHEVCISHRIPRAWEYGDIRGSRHKNNNKIINETSTKDLTITIILPEVRDSPYHRSD